MPPVGQIARFVAMLFGDVRDADQEHEVSPDEQNADLRSPHEHAAAERH